MALDCVDEEALDGCIACCGDGGEVCAEEGIVDGADEVADVECAGCGVEGGFNGGFVVGVGGCGGGGVGCEEVFEAWVAVTPGWGGGTGAF